MHVKKNGYVGGAVLFTQQIRKMRELVEFEKFQCRMAIDNDITREFKMKTDQLKDSIYALRYNNPITDALTAAGRKNGNKQ